MIGTYLKELRQQKGISQQKLADSVGISRRTIINIETNKHIPLWPTALKLIKELLPRYPNGRIDFRTLHKYFEDRKAIKR